jgi:hypothetical protein
MKPPVSAKAALTVIGVGLWVIAVPMLCLIGFFFLPLMGRGNASSIGWPDGQDYLLSHHRLDGSCLLEGGAAHPARRVQKKPFDSREGR